MITVIHEGDKHKQGNMVCPKCGRRVLVERHFGDPVKCNKCNIPYKPIHNTPHYY